MAQELGVEQGVEYVLPAWRGPAPTLERERCPATGPTGRVHHLPGPWDRISHLLEEGVPARRDAQRVEPAIATLAVLPLEGVGLHEEGVGVVEEDVLATSPRRPVD